VASARSPNARDACALTNARRFSVESGHVYACCGVDSIDTGNVCVPLSRLSASVALIVASVLSLCQPTLPNSVRTRLHECSRQPRS
jgi:hypothetical protein